MQLYPAIDIKGGQCVRLTQGLFDNVKVYSDTPADMARMWRDQGATFLHLVDLDGALAGRSVNEAVIRSIVEAIDIPVEIGGRHPHSGGGPKHAGPGRGPGDHRNQGRNGRSLWASWLRPSGQSASWPGVDARDGLVAIQGWEELSSVTARELCLKMKELGVLHIVYTDIARDGMLNGPNVEATRELTMDTGLDIIGLRRRFLQEVCDGFTTPEFRARLSARRCTRIGWTCGKRSGHFRQIGRGMDYDGI